MTNENQYIRWFENLNAKDVPVVGGKNASLGEMIRALKDADIRVPDGFATTSAAYWEFLEANDLKGKIKSSLEDMESGKKPLEKTGKSIRDLFLKGHFPEKIAEAIRNAYYELCKRHNTDELDVAVRSSATAEDLPEASFAGQQESFLNMSGEEELLEACRKYRSIRRRLHSGYRNDRS